MLQTILGGINFSVLLFFGIYVSAAFLSINLNRKNSWVLFFFGVASLGLQMLIYALFGMRYAEMFYPLMTHLPLLLLFVLYFKQKALSGLFSILSAYLCCQVSKWFGLIVSSISHELWAMYAARIILTIPIFYTIIRYASRSLHVILTKSTKTLLIFGILPAIYYLFDYTATVYTRLLYSGSKVVFEFLPFMLCVAYLFFCVIYFKEYEEKCIAEQQRKLIEIQTTQSIKEIEEIKRSKYEVSLIRHDMRHFLSNVSAMIEGADYDKARAYIQKVIKLTDQTAVKKFCENETVNMILSTYESRMADRNIRFDATVAIPAQLPCSELEFTSILSNGLENATNAVSELEDGMRVVQLKLFLKNTKLLLSIHNAYNKAPVFENGLPITDMAGHGFGTQSIQYMTEKLNGNCQFTAEDSVFTLRVVL